MIGRSNLNRLTYFSRSVLDAEALIGNGQLAQLARVSQKKNEFAVITSILLYEKGWFSHVLEGDRGAVYETFQRIAADNRHKDVRIIEWREVARREFVTSFEVIIRNHATQEIFKKFNLDEVYQRGRPKVALVHSLALALQADAMAKRGIEILA